MMEKGTHLVKKVDSLWGKFASSGNLRADFTTVLTHSTTGKR